MMKLTRIHNADQYSRWSNVEIQGIPQSAKRKYLEDKVINVPDKGNVKACYRIKAKKACYRMGDSRKAIVRFVYLKNLLEEIKNKKNTYVC